MYSREKYLQQNPHRKRYASGYKVTGKYEEPVVFKCVKEVCQYTGYAENTVRNILKGDDYSPYYKIEKIYN